jgi:ABC-type phosphate transport system ATPase subunit
MDHNNDGTRRVSYNHFTRKQNVKLLLRHTEVKDIIKLSGLGKSTMIKKEKKRNNVIPAACSFLSPQDELEVSLFQSRVKTNKQSIYQQCNF